MPIKANLKDSKVIARLTREYRADADCFVWDDKLSGFGLRFRNGKATWFVQYKIGAQHRRLTLGALEMLKPDEARNGWKDQQGNWHDGAALILAAAKRGTDASITWGETKELNSQSFGATVADYLSERRKDMRPRTYDEADRHLNTRFKRLHKMPLSSVTRADVAARGERLQTRMGRLPLIERAPVCRRFIGGA